MRRPRSNSSASKQGYGPPSLMSPRSGPRDVSDAKGGSRISLPYSVWSCPIVSLMLVPVAQASRIFTTLPCISTVGTDIGNPRQAQRTRSNVLQYSLESINAGLSHSALFLKCRSPNTQRLSITVFIFQPRTNSSFPIRPQSTKPTYVPFSRNQWLLSC